MATAQAAPGPGPLQPAPYIVERVDPRLTDDFYRSLERFMGRPEACDPAFRPQWEDWWRQHAGTRAQWFRGDMLNRIQHRQPIADRRVLDFGCGTGSSTLVFAEAGAIVTGAEPDAVSLDLARARLRDCGFADRTRLVAIPFLTGRDERLPFDDASFDTVSLIGVVEHMLPHEIEHCFREVRRVLRPGGEVFFYDTPNRLFPFDAHTVRLWFSNWLPVRVARRYAVVRGRMARDADFLRRGGVGVTRRSITRRLGPDFVRVYQKSPADVRADFVWTAREVPWLWRRRPRLAEKLMGTMFRVLCGVGRLAGGDHGTWSMSHVLTFVRREPAATSRS